MIRQLHQRCIVYVDQQVHFKGNDFFFFAFFREMGVELLSIRSSDVDASCEKKDNSCVMEGNLSVNDISTLHLLSVRERDLVAKSFVVCHRQHVVNGKKKEQT